MDTSPEYVRMCEQAEEIQKLKPEQLSDKDNVVYLAPEYDYTKPIWLPRQDDLQKMMQFDAFPHDGAYHFSEFVGHSPFVHSFTSMEQLWLAFVMNKLYQKSWNGQEWVKIPVEVKG